MSTRNKYNESRIVYIHYQQERDSAFAEKFIAEARLAGIKCLAGRRIEDLSKVVSFVRERLGHVDAVVLISSEKTNYWTDPIVRYLDSTNKSTFGIVIGERGRLVTAAPFTNVEKIYFVREQEFDIAVKEIVENLKVFFDKSYYSRHLFFEKFPPKAQGVDRKLPLNEGKLILVGRGEVGKTSLVRRLSGHVFRGDESKTQGINITNLSLNIFEKTYKMHIWDFGGQEIMHATHQFFLTEQSLYLVVINGREGSEDFDVEYWLKQIESFGSASPVIIVQNKISQHEFDLNYRGLRAKYPQIRAFVKTDCKDNIGINSLRHEIEAAVSEMPEISLLIPESWLALKRRLENTNANFIGYDGYLELCNDAGIFKSSDMETLSWVLHCLGIALNYKDDSRLRETSVLKG